MRFRAISIILLLIVYSGEVAADLDENRRQLQQVQQRIENTQIDLQQKEQSEVRFTRELAVLNGTLRKIDGRISQLKKEQQQVLKSISAQQNQVAAGKKKIRATGRRIQKRLVALYKEGEIGPLKILFSADSPTELVQQYHYLTRVVEHDRELLDDYRQVIETHQQELSRLQDLEEQKTSLLEQEKQQRQVAADGRRLQARLLKKVKAEKKQLNSELASLQEKARRLQGLVKKLQQEKHAEPKLQPGGVSFVADKGRLDWPVPGDVLIGFGTKKDKALGTYYESNGLEISATPGTSIKAVADGKVVFADWFNGYGNLMILSHAGGFHSLYAQAAELSRKPGEVVRAGDVVGLSGLAGRDSIYFEIRKDGAAVSPLTWLKRR
ncbi:Septal ring factor EnvC, activator of murein hydrolases AmiA and AmiB [Malonomonas rubra DSM 5091]|uniref:Septal ring factor EnvC, activator of murein hydrolases AmiA and AmiB n=1 Tax=Malonomonas rubra DSM 5091 TaxID=1122189 RepID=A0A1M6BCS0_MALRU|nr:peptidoglycan DD-metalloendopeptidase family protein [Malonomonas rubra]SHI46253.1 Septal ring factor EnvC, activator of murein hydrolases AmiA and AmiB [Malonomonas rubra DSM 5091]